MILGTTNQEKKEKKRREKAGREGKETEGYILITQSVCSGAVAEAERRD